ncbi:MAG TPA: plastocyanin/azurin family copper-binding protein [Solirubrobacterales bacterium]|jgi:plastocyanin|nr:plastocyanin/azurin family copper-binding protein [Solirubrobacterales bacterium]
MRRVSAIATVAVLSMLGLAACGGGDDNSDTTAAATPPPATTTGGGGGGGGGSTVNISTPSGTELAYDQKSASAKAGSVTIDFQNNESIPHDVAIESPSGDTVGQTDLVASGSATTTVDLQPGTYTFFCTVPGHREAGMEGPLTVK